MTELSHIGVARKSGRYPYGSGENPEQHNISFLGTVEALHKKGLSDTEIVKALGLESTTQLRAKKTIAKNAQKKEDIAQALKLQDKGLSNVKIGEAMNRNESSIRDLLNPATQAKTDRLTTTANRLKDSVSPERYLDFGLGTENHLGVSDTHLKSAIAMLKEEGYGVHSLNQPQQGTVHQTKIKVLVPPGTTFKELINNQHRIKSIATSYSEDDGATNTPIVPPRHIDLKRVGVRYAEQGGGDADGVIQLRRGVDDISLGQSKYAQVRIGVNGTHYLKGMAMYSDDMPPGIDMMFNTNKSDTGSKLDAMKPIKRDKEGVVDEDLPFGSVTRQKHYLDGKGKEQLSILNIVNEEENWSKWSKSLSPQMLSKQSGTLAKKQLSETFANKKLEYDEIMGLTNPTVKKKLLDTYAESVDASSVHLKAAALPRQRTQVLLPISSLKISEIYAPNFNPGEQVVLVRFPHGGTFEIPDLTVNNRNPEAKRLMGNAKDAVGIHPKVASRLSGADFDGDTVLVIPAIPNRPGGVRTAPPLAGLKDFNPQDAYPEYPGMPKMKSKQKEMGDISNLITDMTIKGAPHSEIARAVRHSMVVIDAEKHNLNYRLSAKDNNIKALKLRYQGRTNGGADTLISQAKSDIRIPERKARRAKEGGPIDPATGKLMFTPTGASYTNAKGQLVEKKTKVQKLANVDDAFDLSSGTTMEAIYADHSNKLKALANTARKSAYTTPNLVYSPSANKAYAPQVKSLNAKLNLALMNAPLERQAQFVAGRIVKAKLQDYPDMDKGDLKKIKGMALDTARKRVGAGKERIKFEPDEWEAIQAGAITHSKLTNILKNADMDSVRALATPRAHTAVSTGVLARAKTMLANGHSPSEIASALGVPLSTLNDALTSS